MGDDTVYRSFANVKVALPEFLGNDLGAGFRVKESVTNDLADDFLSAAVFCFRASLGTNEGLGPLFTKEGQELKVARAAVVEAGNDFVDRLIPALSGDEHRELAGDLIIVGDREDAILALNPFLEEVERDHGGFCSYVLSHN